MGIARSTYYDAPTVTLDDDALLAAITAICDAFEAYGWRRVRAALRQQGVVANHKRIRRLMRTGCSRSGGGASSPPRTATTTAPSSPTVPRTSC
jgi:hypothetical protein